MTSRRYRAGFAFCGVGGGALGFARAAARVIGIDGSFEIVGGFDVDRAACDDFEMFTGAEAIRKAVETITPEELRAAWGDEPPDIIFQSPPCCGASGLLSKRLAGTEKYQTMNDLALVWTRLMLTTWPEQNVRFLLFENVPLLKHRAKLMLREVKRLLRARGYAIHEGFHDCGELGGLAQHRKRYLMVARDQKRAPYPLYRPIRKRVRACGDELGLLPMPGDARGGPMHELPKISWLNLVRLALIPAGGDWRDLPGVLADGEKRREKFKRHAVEKWTEPTGTIGGSGSNGVEAVADPRLVPQNGNANMHHGKYQVRDWEEPAGTVTGASRVGSGAQSIADPRPLDWFRQTLGVTGWDEPAATVTGAAAPSRGNFAVADPRVPPFGNVDRVTRWDQPMGTVTRSPAPSSGAAAVADPRIALVHDRNDHYFRILKWTEPSFTIATKAHPGTGAYSVADPRLGCAPHAGAYGVLSWADAAKTITGSANIDNGPFAVADPRLPEDPPVAFVERVDRPPFIVRGKKRVPVSVVIVSEDGTWHRPLTTLELAALQGFPTEWEGKALKLSGTSHTEYRRRVGNAVPPPTAEAIAVRFLVTLLQADAGAFALSDAGLVWVGPPPELPEHLVIQ